MIRFVDIRKQGTGCRFAFWDTVHDKFLEFNGDQAWSVRKEFVESFRHVDGMTASGVSYYAEETRFTTLMPDWAMLYDPKEENDHAA